MVNVSHTQQHKEVVRGGEFSITVTLNNDLRVPITTKDTNFHLSHHKKFTVNPRSVQNTEIDVLPNQSYSVTFDVVTGTYYGIRGVQESEHTIQYSAAYTYKDTQIKQIAQGKVPAIITVTPSHALLLIGVVIGSVLGTFASNFKDILSTVTPHQSSATAANISILNTQIIGSFILNIILAIIAMFTLMRRPEPNVTPPVTVNDLYGMIIAGFLVGFSGIEIVKKLLAIP